MRFDLVSANPDGEIANGSTDKSPVCGWLLFNYNDDTLAVYDAAGNALGELVVADASMPGKSWVRWEPVPSSAAVVGAPPAIPNHHLLCFVLGLLNHRDGEKSNDSARAFAELREEISSTLSALDSLGTPDDESLPLLVGRPIAILRGRLRLEWYGKPAWDQHWSQTGRFETGDLEKVEFLARLGHYWLRDSGLYGAF